MARLAALLCSLALAAASAAPATACDPVVGTHRSRYNEGIMAFEGIVIGYQKDFYTYESIVPQRQAWDDTLRKGAFLKVHVTKAHLPVTSDTMVIATDFLSACARVSPTIQDLETILPIGSSVMVVGSLGMYGYPSYIVDASAYIPIYTGVYLTGRGMLNIGHYPTSRRDLLAYVRYLKMLWRFSQLPVGWRRRTEFVEEIEALFSYTRSHESAAKDAVRGCHLARVIRAHFQDAAERRRVTRMLALRGIAAPTDTDLHCPYRPDESY